MEKCTPEEKKVVGQTGQTGHVDQLDRCNLAGMQYTHLKRPTYTQFHIILYLVWGADPWVLIGLKIALLDGVFFLR